MEERGIEVAERVPASRKLGRERAESLLADAQLLYVAKGRVWQSYSGQSLRGEEATDAMLGPTGNLRAPTIRVGKTILVGYNEEIYDRIWGEESLP